MYIDGDCRFVLSTTTSNQLAVYLPLLSPRICGLLCFRSRWSTRKQSGFSLLSHSIFLPISLHLHYIYMCIYNSICRHTYIHVRACSSHFRPLWLYKRKSKVGESRFCLSSFSNRLPLTQKKKKKKKIIIKKTTTDALILSVLNTG